jgi:hypothetical protein
MTGAAWSATLVVVAMLALVIGIYWYGQRQRKQLDQPLPAAQIGGDEPLALSEGCAQGLRMLSSEPILIKQQLDGTRVQIEHRPMVPIALFASKDAAGSLTEVASRVSQRYGFQWVAIVAVREDGSVTVNRIK